MERLRRGANAVVEGGTTAFYLHLAVCANSSSTTSYIAGRQREREDAPSTHAGGSACVY